MQGETFIVELKSLGSQGSPGKGVGGAADKEASRCLGIPRNAAQREGREARGTHILDREQTTGKIQA